MMARTYTFLFEGNSTLKIKRVLKWEIDKEGKYQLTTEASELYIVRPSWLWVMIQETPTDAV